MGLQVCSFYSFGCAGRRTTSPASSLHFLCSSHIFSDRSLYVISLHYYLQFQNIVGTTLIYSFHLLAMTVHFPTRPTTISLIEIFNCTTSSCLQVQNGLISPSPSIDLPNSFKYVFNVDNGRINSTTVNTNQLHKERNFRLLPR